MSYDNWKTETDLDEAHRHGKLYPVACIFDGCERMAGESTVEGSTGVCDYHLDTMYPDPDPKVPS